MKSFTITTNDDGLRINKFLNRLMPNAGSGFLYKMMRKKNITLNHGKCEGNETLHTGDVIEIFFSDETFANFAGKPAEELPVFSKHSVSSDLIVFEDNNLIIAYKPAGILSQKDTPESESMNEMLLSYMAEKGELTAESLSEYKPGVCNRLDRNTPGILLFAKTAPAGRELNRLLRERLIEKYYYAVVAGCFPDFLDSKLYLTKEAETNTVTITEGPISSDSVMVHTDFTPVQKTKDLTLLRIRLHTGKSHQIRSVLSYLGYPVLADPKYKSASEEINAVSVRYRNAYHLHGQLLLAYAYHFPKAIREPLTGLAGRVFRSPVPEGFAKILENEFRVKGDYHAILEIPGTSGLLL
ncbi:MAG: RluA family pseudouridine synthase [Lachnospiraceae bacterium]|nr:RluA family pseudouridine synthase [Lachnospiraceae bacterium]